MSSSDIAGVRDGRAANKQTMMSRVQTSGMRHRAFRNWPLSDHRAFFEIDDGNVTFAVHNISMVTYNFFPEGSMAIPAGSPPGSLMLPTNVAVFVSTISIDASVDPCWPLPPKFSNTSTPA